MGLGDVKLAGVIGAALGFLSFPALVIGAFAAFVHRRPGRCRAAASRGAPAARPLMPFGPAMVAGALLAIFASAPLADAYAHLAQRA